MFGTNRFRTLMVWGVLATGALFAGSANAQGFYSGYSYGNQGRYYSFGSYYSPGHYSYGFSDGRGYGYRPYGYYRPYYGGCRRW
jgi:hypothetical protein